ncbi:KpsF/GutQ family sugar-phosphate isomerase [Neolewinella antarctica]|uniref:Arabinose-5-phosphate isomerase n=1 Tax=Neolewinella antarctica TaxID=442734 RepID=A0ABX0XFW6_9BACT|nr:KpsF/GutQ family sugar-phosphate isomerase [Neolewinella antarctica]NJC28208.1 arabinose-5-phosphate isomerase [Neolewinella antarctica]
MRKPSPVIDVARRTLQIEAAALTNLIDTIDARFEASVTAIYACEGRVIVTGIGKTALVGKKIVATLNSTGTPATFLHAADAIHGDIGMVQPNDIVLAISRSGETAELKMLALLTRQLGNPLIAMVSRPDCSLGQSADYLLLAPFDREADPNELAPTTSTTLQMALGDAVATSLLALRGFSPEDFARYHPGGSLGKQMYLRVSDLYPHNQQPVVRPSTSLQETVLEMTAKCLGATAVLEEGSDRLAGIVTDGDLRRLLSSTTNLVRVTAAKMMTATPKTVHKDTLAIRALATLRQHSITQLPVVGDEGEYLGFLHLHDLVREGLV